jgi:hypothetical protein
MSVTTTELIKTVSIGKGKGVKNLIEVNVRDAVVESTTSGIFLNHDFASSATSDDPYGLRLISMEMNIEAYTLSSSDYYFSAAMSIGTKEVAGSSSDPRNYTNDGFFDRLVSGEHYATQVKNEIPGQFMMRKEPREDLSRIIVLNDIKLGAYFIAAGAGGVTINRQYVFEKVKLSKNEYMEKLVRNINC